MARIQEPLARAGWTCSLIMPLQRFPFHRSVKLQMLMRCGDLLHANLTVNMEMGRVEKMDAWHWTPPPDRRPAPPEQVLDGIAGLAAALRQCPGGYPLTREEHRRQRAKTIALKNLAQSEGLEIILFLSDGRAILASSRCVLLQGRWSAVPYRWSVRIR